ncbi:MAG: hypothetical protein SF002_12270 [Alphaproteobacteria bacterium]|nr:hypothetical protein [Alphaproteobacteria bacterium]
MTALPSPADLVALAGAGRLQEAFDGWEARRLANPEDAEAWKSAGLLLVRTRAWRQALDRLIRAETLGLATPDLLTALAICRQALFDPSHSDAWARARAAAPDAPDILLRQLLAEAMSGDPLRCAPLIPALESHPVLSADGQTVLGLALSLGGDADRARDALVAATLADPTVSLARTVLPRVLPRLYRTVEEIPVWRRRLADGFAALEAGLALDQPAIADALLQATHARPLFQLAYQGEDDRPLMERMGRMTVRAMAARFPHLAAPLAVSRPDGRIRVGFASESLFSHTVARLFSGWMFGLDRQRFAVHAYQIGGLSDSSTEVIRNQVDRFADLRGAIDQAAETIRADRLDVLIYLDHGMRGRTALLAALRLAQHQAIAWGHPVTSGLATIDTFLSSAAMEPTDGASHYSERLVALPGLSIAYTPTAARAPGTRSQFGLPEDRVLCFCAQSLFKYHPEDDDLWPRIAAGAPEVLFLFLTDPLGEHITQQFLARLQRAFARHGLDATRFCHVLPRLDWWQYLALNTVADLFLDSLRWSGGNTSLEAIANGLIPITSPGRFMRGRHTAAMLSLMGLTDLIAPDRDSLATLAIHLIRSPDLRHTQRERLRAAAPTLWQDRRCLEALEGFLLSVAGR